MAKRGRRGESGFSYVDIIIAISILFIGILSLGAALTTALVRTNQNEDYLRAKDLAASTLENVLTARHITFGSEPHSFDAIQNVEAPGGLGVFVSGRRAVLDSPGPDALFGTADDTGNRIGSFERQIVITDVPNPNRPTPPNPITERRIEVTVFFTSQGIEREVTLATNVARY